MSDDKSLVPQQSTPSALEGELVASAPKFEALPDEFPTIFADAELVLPTEVYAPWMRSIHSWLAQAGAKNGHDYKAVVSTAGMDEKKRLLFRVRWHAITEKGVLYLNLMASTLRALESDRRQIGHERASSEKPQISAENDGF